MSWGIATASLPLCGFASAIAATTDAATPGVYTAELKRDWCIGFVPHGGYITSLLLSTASTHMHTHPPLAALHQPHVIHIGVTFFNACVPGTATITLTPIKTGRGYSFIQARITQGPTQLRLEAVLVFADLHVPRRGPTLELAAPTVPARETECEERVLRAVGLVESRPAMRKLRYWVPRGTGDGSADNARNLREHWVAMADGERMHLPALGFLADMFLPLPENYPETAKTHWYPTLALGIEIKRAPPPDGWEWLFCRIHSREIRNGHMDVNVDIVDEQSRLVAVAHQLAIIVGSDRNKPRDLKEQEHEGRGAKL